MRAHRHNPRVLALALTAVIASALLPASAQADMRQLSCEYVESGPPGAAGNLLAIVGNDNVEVRREGDLVLVGTSAGNGPRDFEPIPCGEQATVTNIDRIVYRGTKVAPRSEHQFLLDEREGPLAPGASPEAVDSEIEVEAVLPDQWQARPRVQILAGEGRDEFLPGGGAGRLAVSLEPLPSDAPFPDSGLAVDADLIVVAPPHTIELKLHGGGGRDVLDARSFDRHRGLARSLLLAGDDDKDTLLGTEREDHLEGGAGPDRLFGRGGRDFLYPSAGADTTSGGAGPDFISGNRGSTEPDVQPDVYAGGSGDDYIDARRGGADEISCGTGRDEAVLDEKDIETPRGGRCERLRGPRYSALASTPSRLLVYMAAHTTTIRVPTETRDRLKALAARRGEPAGEVVAKLVSAADEDALLAQAGADFERLAADSAALATYRAESDAIGAAFDAEAPEW